MKTQQSPAQICADATAYAVSCVEGRKKLTMGEARVLAQEIEAYLAQYPYISHPSFCYMAGDKSAGSYALRNLL